MHTPDSYLCLCFVASSVLQWKYGASNKHIAATLDLLKGELGDIIRKGGELPDQVRAADGLLQGQVF